MDVKRVQLWAPGQTGDASAIGWATVSQTEGVITVVMEHEYPGVAPAPGWRVTWRGPDLVVTGVTSNKLLLCREAGPRVGGD